MLLKMMQCKLHRATVTKSDLHYEGSLGIDRTLMREIGLLKGQQIDVLNITNGERFTTYAIEEPEGSGGICIYGAAAHRAKEGHLLIIIAYAMMTPEEATIYKPKVLVLGEKNKIVDRHA